MAIRIVGSSELAQTLKREQIKTKIEMDKKDYLQNKKEAEEKIQAEKEWLAEIKREYIESNAEYDVGERVKVVTPPHKYWTLGTRKEGMTEHAERFAYVDGYEITYKGDIKPTLKKEKKDGTVSKQRDYYNEQTSYLERV